MMAIITMGVCFLLLVLVYPTVCTIITAIGIRKKKTARKLGQGAETIEQIDQSIDTLKKSAFTISLVVTFFILAPFITLVFITDLF